MQKIQRVSELSEQIKLNREQFHTFWQTILTN